MEKIKSIAMKPYLLIFFSVCLLIALSSFKLGVFKASASKKQVDFPVISLVANLTIVEVKVKAQDVLLTLRNDSNKVIKAVSLSSSGVNNRSEMIGTDQVIAPGALYTEQCGLPSPTSQEKGITILAVVYEDGTSDGDAKFVRQIFDARAGTQAQLARILPLFRDVLATPKGMSLMQKWEAIKLKLEQLPEEEQGKSFEFRMGLHDAKELAIDKLKQLERIEQESGEDVARQVLQHIVDRYEKSNLSILTSLKHSQ